VPAALGADYGCVGGTAEPQRGHRHRLRRPERLAGFWAAALGYRSVGFREPYALLLPAERAYPPVILQRVPEGNEFCVCPGAPLDA
jgi:hypothetical protein